MRIFRIAIHASRIDAARGFYESVLGIPADDTVPSRLYYHCGEVILAVLDRRPEHGVPLRATADNLYLATGELDAVHARALAAGAPTSRRSRCSPGRAVVLLPRPRRQPARFVDETTLFLGRGASWS